MISDQKLGIEDQVKTFSVMVYMDFEMQIHSSIIVAPIGLSLFVGLHANEKGDFLNRNIHLSFDMLNKLSMAFDEAEKEFNKLDADLKNKCKLKEESVFPLDLLEYQIHEKIEKQCGRCFK